MASMLTSMEWLDPIETDREHSQWWGEHFKRMKESLKLNGNILVCCENRLATVDIAPSNLAFRDTECSQANIYKLYQNDSEKHLMGSYLASDPRHKRALCG